MAGQYTHVAFAARDKVGRRELAPDPKVLARPLALGDAARRCSRPSSRSDPGRRRASARSTRVRSEPPTTSPRFRSARTSNVLFVLIDTLRASRLHTYGYERPTSPFIDLLASQGVRFARQLSQSSWTKCSMASLWTGFYPQRTGVTRFERRPFAAGADCGGGLPRRRLPHRGHLAQRLGRGLFRLRPGLRRLHPPQHAATCRPRSRRENPTVTARGTDLDVVDTAGEFLRVYGRERWFLYLHLMDVHEYTYSPESAQFGSTYGDVYDNAVLHVNQVLERAVRRALRGWLPRTHAADRRVRSRRGVRRARQRRARAQRLPGDHRGAAGPRVAVPAREAGVVRQRTANVDLWPTVLDLLGLPPLENTDGRSRVPEILAAARGEPGPEDETTAIAHLDQTWGQRVETRSPNVAVSREGTSATSVRQLRTGDAREELFDADARRARAGGLCRGGAGGGHADARAGKELPRPASRRGTSLRRS